MSGRLTYARNGYRAIDCAGCGQEARVDLYGGRLVVQCRAECPEHDVLAGLDVAAVIAELDGKPLAESTLQSFNEIVARPVRWAWEDRIALAKITALAGRPKVGKGLLYSHLIAQVTTGALEGARDVIIVTTEDDPGDTLKPRLMAAGADLSNVSIFQMGSRDDPVPFRVPRTPPS